MAANPERPCRSGENGRTHPALAEGFARRRDSVGEGVSELRIPHGPGYRVYFIRREAELIIFPAGGTKRRQAADIARAKELARDHSIPG